MSQALDLATLQQTDDELATMRADLRDVETRLQGDQELAAARTTLADVTGRLEDARRDQRRLDAAIADSSARIDKEEGRLYDGSIRNPKELTALQHEVETFKTARAALEEELLALLETLEAVTAEHAAAASRAKALEERWTIQSRTLQQDAVRLQARIAGADVTRAAQAAAVPRAALTLYDSIRARRGSGVARISSSNCSGCRVTIPDAVRRRAMSPSALIQCPNCERILVPG